VRKPVAVFGHVFSTASDYQIVQITKPPNIEALRSYSTVKIEMKLDTCSKQIDVPT
jgi:hypothetical protein